MTATHPTTSMFFAIAIAASLQISADAQPVRPPGVALFLTPRGIAVDPAGNVYVAENDAHIIARITPAGVVTTFAGSPLAAGISDGPGSEARFNHPAGLATDTAGNVYVADTDNHTIRKITAQGIVTTIAGEAGHTGSSDGTGAAAHFNMPEGVATDAAGNLYVADMFNRTIRKITTDGVVTTLAGSAGQKAHRDGTGAAARFSDPWGVATDGDGNVYVAETFNNVIRKITPAGAVTTFAGSPGFWKTGNTDGAGSTARFDNPAGLAVDGSGNVYVADWMSATIRKITPAGLVTTLAGAPSQPKKRNGGKCCAVDGPAAVARFAGPYGVATDRMGNVYIADTFNSTIRKITPQGDVSTVAGVAGMAGIANGTAVAAEAQP